MLPFAKPMPSFELKAMATGPLLWFVITELGATFPFALSENSLIVPPVPPPSLATTMRAVVAALPTPA